MKTFLFAFIALMSLSGHAGREGNGGDGLWINEKLYSLDLVEAGVEENPTFDESINLNEMILERLSKKLDPKQFPVTLLARKISELESIDKVFARVVLQTIEHYQWRIVNNSLVDVKDEDSLLDYPEKDLVQLASRSMESIVIARALWKELDEKNKVGLVLHEVFYALQKPGCYLSTYNGMCEVDFLTGIFKPLKVQSSFEARQLTGYLFTSDFNRLGKEGLQKLSMNIYYPVSEMDTLIFERDGSIDFDPRYSLYAYLPEFYSGGTLFQSVSYKANQTEIDSYIKAVCETVVKNNVPLYLSIREKNVRIQNSFYVSKKGKKSYLDTNNNFSSRNENRDIPYRDLSSCLKNAQNELTVHFNYVNSNFE